MFYPDATRWTEALARGEVSSVEAVTHFMERYERHNQRVNAIIAINREGAMRRAQEADEARAKGVSWGILHGLPMTVKDSFEVVGMPTTAGAEVLKHHRAHRNADAVQRLVDAGAIIFGKTNLPRYAMDLQSYNEVHGTTRNPYDGSRTSGGSSGGAAAALAAGLTPLELGSDIAGSIRVPAHFCGVYGHKPTWGVVPLRGHIPGPPGMLMESELAVAGAMGMSADDLALMMGVLVGARSYDAPGVEIRLPEASGKRFEEYRVAWWMEDAVCPIDSQMAREYEGIKKMLRDAGVTIVETSPLGKDVEDYVRLYGEMLGAVIGASLPLRDYWQMCLTRLFLPVAQHILKHPHFNLRYVRGVTLSHRDYLFLLEQREQLRFALRDFFHEYDVLLAPIAMLPAFEHVQAGDISTRKLTVNGQDVPYAHIMRWSAFATLMGLPATSAPVGMIDGLPMNVQIIGGAYRDCDTIDFARHLTKLIGGIGKPEGFEMVDNIVQDY